LVPTVLALRREEKTGASAKREPGCAKINLYPFKNERRTVGRLKQLQFFFFARFRERNNKCPYCQSGLHVKLQTRKLLLQARKCHYCGLIFRWPASTDVDAKQFYEAEYDSGIVTDLPSGHELATLKQTTFGGSRFDKRYQIDWIENYCPAPSRVLCFGSSWGYTDYQIKARGYTVEGFELSSRRAKFGEENLGLTIHSSWESLKGRKDQRPFDAIFAAETLEHVTDLKTILNNLSKVLKPGGHLIILVPNGAGLSARREGLNWTPFLGFEHTIAFTPEWLKRNLAQHGFGAVEVISTTTNGAYDTRCDGDGLLCVARFGEGEVQHPREHLKGDAVLIDA